MGLRREQKISKRSDFLRVFKKGRVAHSRLITIRACKNEMNMCATRYGLSVSRHVGGAVVRNKLKRQLREILSEMPAQMSWDVVVIARRQAAESSFKEISDEVNKMALQLGFVSP